MSVVPLRDRRSERTAATRQEILEAAWAIVRSEGLAALSMRDLGARVGMRAQSLYVYFPSKHAIYDAMFGEGNRELLSRLTGVEKAEDPVDGLRRQVRMFVDFCVEDPVRYQLLFERTIPGFEPSPDAYGPALQVLQLAQRALHSCGIDDPTALDAWTAVTGGITAQQNANQPGGRRWVDLLDVVIDMFLDHYRKPSMRSQP